MDTIYVITTNTPKQQITAVTHCESFALRLATRSRVALTKHSFGNMVLPRYTSGRIKHSFKVWVVLDKDNAPKSVKLTQPESGRYRAFESTQRRDYVEAHYDKFYITLDDENNNEGIELQYITDYFRKESSDRLKKNLNTGNLVFITHRRRYSNSLPYRLEISINRNIGTRSSRLDIANSLYDDFETGKLDVNRLEYNVDYTLTPRDWSITSDMFVRDEEISVN